MDELEGNGTSDAADNQGQAGLGIITWHSDED